uniref:hypothetical protein n=1 Tax=Escherichia coli TaxID=562 RepID=UPI001BCCDACD|nr:hypothetical protein [Escherichia coli]
MGQMSATASKENETEYLESVLAFIFVGVMAMLMWSFTMTTWSNKHQNNWIVRHTLSPAAEAFKEVIVRHI